MSEHIIDAANLYRHQGGFCGGFYFRVNQLAAGQTHDGHAHHIDHATIFFSGCFDIEWQNTQSGKSGTLHIAATPCVVLIKAEAWHRITATEDGTYWCCFAHDAEDGGTTGAFYDEISGPAPPRVIARLIKALRARWGKLPRKDPAKTP